MLLAMMIKLINYCLPFISSLRNDPSNFKEAFKGQGMFFLQLLQFPGP